MIGKVGEANRARVAEYLGEATRRHVVALLYGDPYVPDEQGIVQR
jgi:succinyl-CoA synthetase alpha subunit